jgi:hypothetical protein
MCDTLKFFFVHCHEQRFLDPSLSLKDENWMHLTGNVGAVHYSHPTRPMTTGNNTAA